MPQIDMPYTVHLDQSLRVMPLSTLFAKGDNAAHKFALTVLRGGVQDDLNGCTVNCKFYRMAESTVVNMTGSVEDCKAVAVLDKACYDYTGRFTLTISIKQGEAITTVFYGDGYMQGRSADTAITGEYIVYDIDTLLAKLDEIDAATRAANAAARNANTAAGSANTAASNANDAKNSANAAARTAKTAANAANAAATRLDGMTATATGLPASSAPTVAVTTGEDGAKRLDFGIPKGEKGDTGATPQLTINVTTGEPGTQASVTQSGTAEKPVIDLTIPRGNTGDIGALKINGKSPDASGAVTLDAVDVGAATDEEVSQLKDDKLDKTATAADSAKLGGKLPAEYASASVAAAHEASIGDAWTSGKTYAVGDYCISGNRLYKCKTAHTAGSAFNADYWDAVSASGEIAKLKYGKVNIYSAQNTNVNSITIDASPVMNDLNSVTFVLLLRDWSSSKSFGAIGCFNMSASPNTGLPGDAYIIADPENRIASMKTSRENATFTVNLQSNFSFVKLIYIY